jgi:putative NADH-flavin reductase
MPVRPVQFLAVFGGSGATGRRIIERAVAQGLQVRTLVRHSSAFEFPSDAVEVLVGSLQSPKDVERTLCDCDGICCVFGPRPPFTDIFCADSTRLIVEAMHRCKVNRIVCQTGAMIGDYRQNRTWPFRFMVWLFNRLNRAMAKDRADQERVIKESGLKWTIVKPPRLTDQPANGVYVAGPEVKVGLLSTISRVDIAMFMVNEVVAPNHIGEPVFIRGMKVA